MEEKYYMLHQTSKTVQVLILFPILLFFSSHVASSNDTLLAATSKTYIVHVEPHPDSLSTPSLKFTKKYHRSFFPTPSSASTKHKLIYSYNHVLSGFAARLTEPELTSIKKKPGFLHAIPDGFLSIQTTHTPQFLGLTRDSPGFWNDSNFGKGIIVGVLDTGIASGHPSFANNPKLDVPPPSKWKGSCEYNSSDCNNKLIGAKTFLAGQGNSVLAPYDDYGHGTHTASTAVGNFIDNANVDGQVNGTASGLAPLAHLAVYKVCDERGRCSYSDVLAGLDAAVSDGVDIVSLSLANTTGVSLPFYEDNLAIAAFGAIEKGVFVSCAAGNNGPLPGTLSNEAPWILTVGASTVDRTVSAVVLAGDLKITGQSLYQPMESSALTSPLVYPGAMGSSAAAYCSSLDGFNVTGKTVLCDDGDIDRISKGVNVKEAGGAAIIIANLDIEGYTTSASAHVLPASHISYSDGLQIKSYLNSTSSPEAALVFLGTTLGTTPAPAIAYFSSRGPNQQAGPNILKPDIIGPGVNILAAWPTQVGLPTASATFNLDSGTSMATPHLSGIAALLKAAHPNWSPAAIKSAIMTTADVTANDGSMIPDEKLNPADLFAVGAGHVNPTKATDPGLIYDISSNNYIAYLCGLNYTNGQVSIITRRSVNCSDQVMIARYGTELNYPSFLVTLNGGNGYSWLAKRQVMNVGDPNSMYTVQVSAPVGVTVMVKPQNLTFMEVGESIEYTVGFSINTNFTRATGVSYVEGSLVWVSSSNITSVRSPIKTISKEEI